MKTMWHYIKNNDYPTDEYDKVLVIKDDSCNESPLPGYRYEIGFWRQDIKAWDSTEHGFIKDSENVVAWCMPPMVSKENF